MSDSEVSRRRPGRPRSFDEATVLGAATRLFWRDGYGGASMPEISAVTGLSTSSLYNAYGSKLDLLVAALDHYSDTVLDRYMLGPLLRGTEGLGDVDAFLDRLGATIDADQPRGCLAVNMIAEFREATPSVAARTERYRRQLRDGLHAALSRAGGLGEIPAGAADRRADALVPIVVAFNLLVAARAPSAETRNLLSAARDLAHVGVP